MTIRLEGDTIRLEGDCYVEEAETLVQLLQAEPGRGVDLTLCRQLHAAIAQVLLVFRPSVAGSPEEPFLRDLILPALTRSTGVRDATP